MSDDDGADEDSKVAGRVYDEDGYWTPTEEEKNQIIKRHEKWLDTPKKERDIADRADFSRANLANVFFRNLKLNGANFQDANLFSSHNEGVHFIGANLNGTIFDRAAFDGTVFRNANLQNAKLRHIHFAEVDLENADCRFADFSHSGISSVNLTSTKLNHAIFTGANIGDNIGMRTSQLGGTDLTGTKLTDDIGKFEGLKHVEDLSKHARNIFLSVVGGCVFSWLTIATTTDASLITNAANSGTKLPVIGTSVPIAGFFWAAPVILFALYIYLNLYLQRLWEGMASLPAIFPDGRTLDERSHPWLLSGIIRKIVPRLSKRPLAQSWVQFSISVVATWMLVPATIGFFLWRYLPRHDWFGTVWIWLLFAVSIAYGIYTYRLARKTLKGNLVLPSEEEILENAKKSKWVQVWAFIWPIPLNWAWLAATLIAAGWSFLAIEIGSIPFTKIEIGYAQLQGAILKNANLENMDLRRALMSDADLANANLKEADLSGAILTNANLTKAKLGSANLQSATLYHAYLHMANLESACLLNTDLQRADLTKANLNSAFLAATILNHAKLGGVSLKSAIIDKVTFKGVDLKKTKIPKANWKHACGDDGTTPPDGFPKKLCPEKREEHPGPCRNFTP